MIPAADAKNWVRIWRRANPWAEITLLNFMPNTGNTHGIILRIRPPIRAKPIIFSRLFVVFGILTGVSVAFAVISTARS